MEPVKSEKGKILSDLKALLVKGEKYVAACAEHDLSKKPSAEKWSKKEILGHLIDSGINNLQRFTEIQFGPKPFVIHPYKQNELVKANNYQNADIQQIMSFWLSVNHWILNLIDWQTEKSLTYEVELPDGELSDLKLLMQDYVDHLAHHLNQIMDKNRS